MISALHQFEERIKQLLSFIDTSEAINEIAGTTLPDIDESDLIAALRPHLIYLKNNSITRKLNVYASSVVLLYGMFEQYVEELIVAYLLELEHTIPNFDDMPEKIKETHTGLSAQLLLNSQLDKYRDRCNVSDIVQRMHLCVNGENFRLNTIAFIDHKSNFRIESINQFFAAIGISGISGLVKKVPGLQKSLSKRFPEGDIDRMSDKIIFEDLDDLVWRRNMISHGWPNDTLSVDMMKERIEFVKVLGQSLYYVLRQSVLPYIVKYRGYSLSKPIAVYNNTIACFKIESGSLSDGDKMISRSLNGRYCEGKILELQVDGVQKLEVSAPPDIDVACKLNFKAKDNWDYFLIKE
jgi:hypothetical protein